MKGILSIDDSKAVHAFMDHVFKNSEFKLFHAMNGDEGLRVWSENKSEIALILLDWEMPGKIGPEVLKDLRSTGAVVPILMVTTKNNIEDISSTLEAGASDYVMKPFTPEILLEKVRMALG